MAKSQERRLAKELYIKGKSQKEIARLLNVVEKTVGVWVDKYGWKQERDARLNSEKSRTDNLKELIGALVEKRLQLTKELEELKVAKADSEAIAEKNREAVSIADEVAKYNKALENLDKTNRISLNVYLDVMDAIFQALQGYDPKLYIKLLDFQEVHLSDVSLKLG